MLITMDLVANCNNDEVIVSVFVNNTKIFSSPARTDLQTINYVIDDAPSSHSVQIVMSGKEFRHTVFNQQEEIESDVFFTMPRVEFDGVNVTDIFCLGKKCYTHSFNNSDLDLFVDEFYGILGCNGTVEIQVETPVYLWFLNYFDC